MKLITASNGHHNVVKSVLANNVESSNIVSLRIFEFQFRYDIVNHIETTQISLNQSK